jgi:hypothetical protein
MSQFVVFENPRLVDVVARRASRTVLGHFRFDGNSQGGAGGFSCGGAFLRTGAVGKYYRWSLWVVSERQQSGQHRPFSTPVFE